TAIRVSTTMAFASTIQICRGGLTRIRFETLVGQTYTSLPVTALGGLSMLGVYLLAFRTSHSEPQRSRLREAFYWVHRLVWRHSSSRQTLLWIWSWERCRRGDRI